MTDKGTSSQDIPQSAEIIREEVLKELNERYSIEMQEGMDTSELVNEAIDLAIAKTKAEYEKKEKEQFERHKKMISEIKNNIKIMEMNHFNKLAEKEQQLIDVMKELDKTYTKLADIRKKIKSKLKENRITLNMGYESHTPMNFDFVKGQIFALETLKKEIKP